MLTLRLLATVLIVVPLAGCSLSGSDGPELRFASAVAPDDGPLVLGRDTVVYRPPVDLEEYYSLAYELDRMETLPTFPVEIVPGGVRIDGFFQKACVTDFRSEVRRKRDGVEITVGQYDPAGGYPDVYPMCTSLYTYTAEVTAVGPGDRIQVVHYRDGYNGKWSGQGYVEDAIVVVLDTVLVTGP